MISLSHGKTETLLLNLIDKWKCIWTEREKVFIWGRAACKKRKQPAEKEQKGLQWLPLWAGSENWCTQRAFGALFIPAVENSCCLWERRRFLRWEKCRVSCQKSKYKIIRVCEYHVQSRCCIIKRTKQKTITLGMLNVFWLVWMHYDSERWQWMIFFLLCPAFIRHIWQLIDSLRLGRLWCHKRPYLPNLCTTVFFPPVGCSVRRIRPVSTIPVQSSATRVRKGLTRKVENQKKPENWIKLLQQLNLQASEPVRLRHWRALNHICVWSQHVGKLCGYWWLEELYSVAWR